MEDLKKQFKMFVPEDDGSAMDWFENTIQEVEQRLEKIYKSARKTYLMGHKDGVEAERERVKTILQKELETWAKESIGAKAVESVILAVNLIEK